MPTLEPLNMKTDKKLREHLEEFERLQKRLQGCVNTDSRTEATIVLRYMKDVIDEMILATVGLTTEESVRVRQSLHHPTKSEREPECCPSLCVKYGERCAKAPNPCATQCIGDCRGGDGPCPNNSST